MCLTRSATGDRTDRSERTPRGPAAPAPGLGMAALCLAGALGALAAPGTPGPQPPESGGPTELLLETLAGREIPELGWPDRSDDPEAVGRFYERRGFTPAWSRGGRPTRQAQAVVGLLEASAAKGLDPADYGAPGWQERFAGLRASGGSEPAELARLDRMLTASLVRYASDLDRGRVDPRCLGIDLDPGLDPVTGRLEEPDHAATAAAAAAAADPLAVLAALEPSSPGYRRLLGGLSRQRELARRDPTLSSGISSIELALERWRWAPRALERPSVVVNVPEFRLRAFDEAGRVAFSTEVVVGEACGGHRTPIFAAVIDAVVFRPAWYVPTSIARGELVPAAARDPGYLRRRGYEIVGREGEAPTAELLSGVATGGLRLRQKPGPGNALGLVKFSIRSRYDVHLHDTPAGALFAEPRRDFSHGCIRVADPSGLAVWVLRDLAGWGPERVRQAMHGTRDELAVTLRPPTPVLVAYATVVATEEGELAFFEDIYGHDVRLRAALDRGRPYPRYGACGEAQG
jgi:murein L,D-transpeptidase YcbB/YkuD